MFDSIGEMFQLSLMNFLYHQQKYNEEQWMAHVDKALIELKKNPKFADRDMTKFREKQRQQWRDFVALSDKQ